MESNRIEYKRELTDTLEKEVVAFLNYHDGSAIHPGQDQDDFFAGYSMPRNKTLMRVFKDLDMVEYLGSGMPRILKAYSRESYIFSTHFIRTAFPVSQKALALEREVAGTTTEKSDQKELQERLLESDTVDNILKLCRINPAITISEMAAKLELTEDGINYHLNKLRSQNRLARVGGRKFGRWEIRGIGDE